MVLSETKYIHVCSSHEIRKQIPLSSSPLPVVHNYTTKTLVMWLSHGKPKTIFVGLVLLSCAVQLEAASSEQTEDETLEELEIKTVKMPKTCKRSAAKGDRLRVHYVGRLGKDGKGKVFDSSKDRGNTFNFELGAGQVSLKPFANDDAYTFM